MCTAISYRTDDHYFGRNLDLEYSYNETVTITPRNYILNFRKKEKIERHFAIIGMAFVVENYPLYYDATNEKGLSIAGLNFPENAYYNEYSADKDNITPFEFIPWILSQCENVSEAQKLLANLNFLNENFSENLPLTPLHWIISDKHRSITVEPTKHGIKVFDNFIGVLTNNPTFDYQMFNLNNYMALNIGNPQNTFLGEKNPIGLEVYSRGMGAIGLPGDNSSMSRFVRAVFVKMNSVSGNSEKESISQFFHILRSVEMQRGCVEIDKSLYSITIYSSCCNTSKGIYYYTTYDNNQISAVDINKENLKSTTLIQYPLQNKQTVYYQN